MHHRYFIQPFSMIASWAVVVVCLLSGMNLEASASKFDELPVSRACRFFTSDQGRVLQSVLDQDQIKRFKMACRTNLWLSYREEKDEFIREKNSAFLGGAATEPRFLVYSHENPRADAWMVIDRPLFESLFAYEQEALFFHFISVLTKIENEGEFALTEKFLAIRKEIWLKNYRQPKECKFEVYDQVLNQKINEIKVPNSTSSFVPVDDKNKIHVEILFPPYREGKILYHYAKGANRRKTSGNRMIEFFGADLLEKELPTFEITPTQKRRVVVSCGG